MGDGGGDHRRCHESRIAVGPLPRPRRVDDPDARERTYLPGIRIPETLLVTSSLDEALDGAGIVFMAVPSHGFRAVLRSAAAGGRGRGRREPGQGN